ncbi:MAG: bifunctional precorrin-2 dehydrogenase/sirohydrochlorin ferrochelatase [Desulfuromonadales bacterium]|nr:bifunctional precorrin-2 dehydrogenase/sirohydrochlorin ferrochelatase [Desulfuromonadales bacterium]
MSTEIAGYPVVLRLSGRRCVVIGGGEVARRKVAGLLAADARIEVIAPYLHPELLALPGIELTCRPFLPDDLCGAFLAFAATNDRNVNAAIAAAARQLGVPVNIADDPEESDFHLPAILSRGDLLVAVSSGGSSPAFAAELRDHLATKLGPEWELFCAVAGALRQKRLTDGEASAYNRAVISDLFAADLPLLLSHQDEAAIDRCLTAVTGIKITLADLGIHFGKGTT